MAFFKSYKLFVKRDAMGDFYLKRRSGHQQLLMFGQVKVNGEPRGLGAVSAVGVIHGNPPGGEQLPQRQCPCWWLSPITHRNDSMPLFPVGF